MLAAVTSLLLVILFVLLLNIYAKWFLAQARHRRRTSMSVSHVLRPAATRFHHFHSFTFDTTTVSSSPSKGLEAAIVASIPLFVYRVEEHNPGLECVVCLSPFDENDVGRNLPKCGHAFHVECIDMWLHSHSNCPICRAPVVVGDCKLVNDVNDSVVSGGESLEVVSSELGVSDVGDQSRLEIASVVSTCEGEDVVVSDSSSSSSSSALSSTLGCSLKRMLSRNRSECKVFPSSNCSVLNV
ncbi:zf-RING_2 domain-containing protein [Cephalotus follicularis]|uniref:RING-type E3 ubiquitin transferase n=1 Tax=Cephalotus follicularis TaxID=3775 RepID=A0A1Q3BFF0_CEPFO|nr:zf-RING_2 domain-containing protein [Cephalotus follicularis]